MTPDYVDQCWLCLRRAKLNYSHILPEFLYLKTYDPKHRALKISGNSEKAIYIQKGEREYLLCDECEAQFSKYEDYAAPIIKSIPSLLPDITGQFLEAPIVEYKRFKLFQMSLLWRASVSTNPMFSLVSLGNQEERLRTMLLENRPGKPHNYGCIMIVLTKTKYLNRIVWSPVKDAIDDRTCFRFQTGEIFWYFFISSFPKTHLVRDLFLSEAGDLKLVIAPWSEAEVISRIAGLIAGKRAARNNSNSI